MTQADVLILGGGLAGLSAAYHLQKLGVSSLVVERNARVGGTAGSVEAGGFVFDHSGHLLHLHDAYGKALVLDLLGGNVAVHQRRSWIHLRGRLARYPFQANTYGLPPEVAAECVSGFLETVHWPRPMSQDPSFEEWSLRTFGRGISRHFMFPYNRKLWRTPLSRMTTEWQGRFVPKPSAIEVVYGALRDQKKFFGYNASFRYPKRGGIQVLPDALAARLEPGRVATSAPARSIDLERRVAVVEGVGEVRYEKLVNTLPLPDFIDLAGPWPSEVRSARRRLRWTTVYCLNLGVRRPRVSDSHWIYYPEKEYPFYRVGFASNFSRTTTPPGCSSLYIEVSRDPGRKADLKALEGEVMRGLRRCGLLKASDRVAAKAWVPIPCAYVVYDRHRTPAVKTIFAELARLGVESIGRYGAWKYSFMEETLLDGKRAAERLTGRAAAPEAEDASELRPLK